ncbi:MAG: GMC family oxidoreductase [Deltaproteobacteria bacterium]|nr:GMC family oxidoreductase [Deltaproteobacteria bacterium]
MAKRIDKADVVVVGSGAGGAPVALSLAEAGARVVVLDKGPYYTVSDFSTDEVAICRRDFWIPWASKDPHTLRKSPNEDAKLTREGWTSQCVGGSTVHMSGFTYRLKQSDFKLKTLTGGLAGADIADWPIDLKDMLPYYDLMEQRVGISGQWRINPFENRSRPFPLPAMRPHPAAQLIDSAAASLGKHSFPTPMAIISKAYGNRGHCTYCGFCGEYGCETTARSTILATLIPQAEATGRCEIRPHSMVTRILVDDKDQASGVEYLDAEGKPHKLEAGLVILAASAIESARLLLMSDNGRFPKGLANRSGLVGKNLMFSTFGKGTGIFDREKIAAKVGTEGMDLPFLLRSSQDDYWNESWSQPLPKGGTHNFLFHHPNPINAAVRLAMDSKWKLWGQPMKDRIHRYFHNELWIEFEVFGEFLANPNCFVDLDPSHKDNMGLPVARITLGHHPVSADVNRLMVRHGMDILEAVQPKAKKVYPWAWANTTFHLQHGTCRFGTDPAHSVLDRNCQSHDIKNLYVTDGSFMPTAGAMPATPTLEANGFRVADSIIARMEKGELPRS